ncbi:hypothetical protein [Melioribacter sp. OK-6-Me]|uniref:hypothetical protein n=1 Tax=unclassified Melioribacter TaxID=2627329 RepID=UPI003EDB0C78
MINKIEELLQRGRFSEATKFCKELISSKSLNLDDEIHFQNELKNIFQLWENFKTNSIGETYLPVVDLNLQNGSLLKIKCSYDNYNDIIVNEEWTELLIQTLPDFIELYLKREFPELLILDWNLNSLKCGLKKNSSSQTKYEIDGRSFFLPLFFAAISLLTEQKVPENYCFTGDVVKDNNKYLLKKVSGVDLKKSVVEEELPDTNNFIYPDDTTSDLSELVKKIFAEKIKNIVNSPLIKRYFLLEKRNATSNFGLHKLISIKTKPREALKIEDFPAIAEFLHHNIEILKDEGTGVIIDGPAPIVVYSMISSFTEIFNSLPNFFAITYTSAPVTNPEFKHNAIVIKTSKVGASKLKAGQILQYN